MEVHQHAHTPRKKFTHYLWEFLMLFFAVFCGFLAENIREHKIEKGKEKDYVRSLVEDLKRDTTDLNSVIESCVLKKNGLDSLALVCFSYLNIDSHNRQMYRLYTAYALNRRGIAFNKATITQLKNSGALRLIRNQQVVDSILGYDNFCEGAITQDDVLINFLQVLINSACNYSMESSSVGTR